MTPAPLPREGRIVAEVVRGVLRDRQATGVVLSVPDGPERRLLCRWLEDAGVPVAVPGEEDVARLAAALSRVALADGATPPAAGISEEAHRAAGRTLARHMGFITASAMNRTALLLSGSDLPPEPLLPLGDLPASQVMEAMGGCTLPGPFSAMEAEPEAVAALDRFLRHRDERLPGGAPSLPEPWAAGIRSRLLAGRWALGAPIVIPRLGARTPGDDLAGR